MRNDSIVRLVTVTILGILVLWIISTLLFGSGMGFGMGFNGNFGGGHMNIGYGFGYGSSFAYLLTLLIKVLFVVFVIALVAGIAVWIKNNIFTKEDFDSIKNTFRGNNNFNQKNACSACGKTMELDWKVCPHCGKTKAL